MQRDSCPRSRFRPPAPGSSPLERGPTHAKPLISSRFPMSDYKEAFEVGGRGGPAVLKCLLMPGFNGR